jgi:ribulose 1,5-bisphosphate synthetase/thiazole synthase
VGGSSEKTELLRDGSSGLVCGLWLARRDVPAVVLEARFHAGDCGDRIDGIVGVIRAIVARGETAVSVSATR